MKQEKVFADLYIHLHADKPMQAASQVKRHLQATAGVVSVYFGDACRQSLHIAYNPRHIAAEALLNVVRLYSSKAVRVASIITRAPALNAGS